MPTRAGNTVVEFQRGKRTPLLLIEEWIRVEMLRSLIAMENIRSSHHYRFNMFLRPIDIIVIHHPYSKQHQGNNMKGNIMKEKVLQVMIMVTNMVTDRCLHLFIQISHCNKDLVLILPKDHIIMQVQDKTPTTISERKKFNVEAMVKAYHHVIKQIVEVIINLLALLIHQVSVNIDILLLKLPLFQMMSEAPPTQGATRQTGFHNHIFTIVMTIRTIYLHEVVNILCSMQMTVMNEETCLYHSIPL